ncbi:MAG: alpha/beta hydrolase [Desulfurococcales archaeon]|nr:alpha/beta hydrolase [Desulfurococcales archaeon]
MPLIYAYGVRTSYKVYGEGKPIVLIHGLNSNKEEFSPLIPEFSRQFMVVTYDLPGHGESEAPNGLFKISDFARHLRELVEKLNIQKPHILGFSMGGGIALEYALSYPYNTDKLILVSSSARLGKLFQNEYYELIAVFRDIWSNIQSNPIIWALRGLIGWDRSRDLGKVGNPTLIIHGDNDIIIPVEEAYLLHKSIPGSKLVIIKGVGHDALIEKHHEIIRIIMQFLTTDDLERYFIVS